MIGQRMKLVRKPKRKVMDKRKGSQSARTWKLILGTSRLLQNLASLSTPQ